MKTRTNLHAGESICPEANLWKKRASMMADTLTQCKKITKDLQDLPAYVYPVLPVVLPVAGGSNIPVIGSTGGYYDGRDYSGYCG